MAAGFLGDYVCAAATRAYGAAVWNDARNAANCPAINEYRQELHEEAVATGVRTAEAEEPRGEEEPMQRGPKDQEEEGVAPAVQEEYRLKFGNTDIYGGSYANPTAQRARAGHTGGGSSEPLLFRVRVHVLRSAAGASKWR